jgi:hypothetical protein
MAKRPYGKNIDLHKKYNKRPSNQSSAIPPKILHWLQRLENTTLKNNTYYNPTRGTGFNLHIGGSNTTNLSDRKGGVLKYSPGMSNPFYLWLLDNAIARTSRKIPRGAQTSIPITDRGTLEGTYLLVKYQFFYIYDPFTYQSVKLQCANTMDSRDTSIDISSFNFIQGGYNFRPGSFIVPDYKSIAKKAVLGGRYDFQFATGSSTYLCRIFTQNYWYCAGNYYTNYGNGSSPAFTNNTNTYRSISHTVASDQAPTLLPSEQFLGGQATFYISVSGGGDADLEFKFYAITTGSGDGLTGIPTQHEIALETNQLDDTYTSGERYYRPYRVDFGGLSNFGSLPKGTGIACFIRSTNKSNVYLYGDIAGLMQYSYDKDPRTGY